MARPIFEVSEHDQLVLMMARYFKDQGFRDIKADLSGWQKPDSVYYTNNPSNKYIPDITCLDTNGLYIILEAETCSTFADTHTHEQFAIFRAHANNTHGRFDIVVPRMCGAVDARQSISNQLNLWGIRVDNIWTPSN